MRPLAPVLGVVLLLLAASAVPAGPLEGRWQLIEETYGGGKGNLAKSRTVELEFTKTGPELFATIRIKKDGLFVAWPAAPEQQEPDAVRVVERIVPSTEDRVRIRYTIDPRPGDDLALEIVEDYRVTDDGRALVGTVDVSFFKSGEPRGSYKLHRRFERRP